MASFPSLWLHLLVLALCGSGGLLPFPGALTQSPVYILNQHMQLVTSSTLQWVSQLTLST